MFLLPLFFAPKKKRVRDFFFKEKTFEPTNPPKTLEISMCKAFQRGGLTWFNPPPTHLLSTSLLIRNTSDPFHKMTKQVGSRWVESIQPTCDFLFVYRRFGHIRWVGGGKMKKLQINLVFHSLIRTLATPRTFGFAELTSVRKNPNIFGPTVLFCSIQTNEMQAFLCFAATKFGFSLT